MQESMNTYHLANGVEIPMIGFGTYRATEGEVAYQAVRTALEVGYRHIDTAAGYGNEASVGKAVRDGGVERSSVFITSKLPNANHGYELTMASFEETMQNLGMDYIDMYLIHWPNPIKFRDCWEEVNAGSWRAFEELYGSGRIRAIGVSNFRSHHIDALLKTANVAPMVNQIRICPGGDTNETIIAYCRGRNIQLEAYSPLGVGRVFEVPQMQALAAKYERSIAQISLRWSLQNGYLPLPKSVHRARMAENMAVFDFEISNEDMETITSLSDCCGHAMNPDIAPH